MAERTNRTVTKGITAASLAVGLAGATGWTVAGQTPPVFEPSIVLPIPDLPKPSVGLPSPRLAVPAAPTHLPQPPAVPPIPRRETLPLPVEALSPSRPDFNLRTVPERHTLTFDAIPPSPPPTFPTMPPREVQTMRLDKALLSAAIGATLAGAPAYAQDDKTKIPSATESGKKVDPPKDVDAAKPADLKKELDAVKALLESLTAKQKQLGDAVLGKDEGKGPDAGMAKKLDDLAASMKTLDENVKKLEEKITKLGDSVEKARIANSSPLTNKETVVAKPTGIVKLINGYGDRVTMIVNGTPHRLEPGETKDVNVTPGVFDYALPLAGGELKTSQVKDNEIVTLRIK